MSTSVIEVYEGHTKDGFSSEISSFKFEELKTSAQAISVKIERFNEIRSDFIIAPTHEEHIYKITLAHLHVLLDYCIENEINFEPNFAQIGNRGYQGITLSILRGSTMKAFLINGFTESGDMTTVGLVFAWNCLRMRLAISVIIDN